MAFLEGRAAKRARLQAQDARQDLDRQLANRQAIINPYANVTDLSSMIQNPFANLQVATGAAQMQAAETDISLASTLDTLRSTGAAGGGATALAQAVARSKQTIANTIQNQEARNAQLRASGEQAAMQLRMGEAQRLQEADILGQTFMFQAQEQRDVADLSRTAAMQQQYEQQFQDAKAANKELFGQLGMAAAMAMSDMRLKKNIKLIGKSNSGLNIYLFEYINEILGKGVYQGVMAHEVPDYAVVNIGEYKAVNYSKIDVEFKRIK